MGLNGGVASFSDAMELYIQDARHLRISDLSISVIFDPRPNVYACIHPYPSLSIPIHPFFCRLCWRMAQNLRIAQRHRVGSAGSAGYALLQTRRPGSPDSSDLCGSSWACPRCLGLRLHPVELGDSDRGLHGAWHGDRLRSSWISRPMCRRGHNENGDSLPI